MLTSGWALGPDRGPAHALVFDVVAYLQPEKISVEGERLVMVVDGDEAVTKFQVHAIHLKGGASAAASSFLIGFVITMMTQEGMTAAAEWLRAR